VESVVALSVVSNVDQEQVLFPPKADLDHLLGAQLIDNLLLFKTPNRVVLWASLFSDPFALAR
jgi:hypothetical protein